GAEYDDLCLLQLKTEKNLLGRVVQDVVTRPSKKWARIQGTRGALEWVANYNAKGDAVLIYEDGTLKEIMEIPKTRPDDFIDELKTVDQDLNTKNPSSISLERGLDSLMVVA